MKTLSELNPQLRRVWSASTLDALLKDPLSYKWQYVDGYRAERGLPMAWGIAWHEARATYITSRLRGHDRDTAIQEAAAVALREAEKFEVQELASESNLDRKKRNVRTLLRTIVWFDAEFGEGDIYEPVMLDDRPAVEIPFALPIVDPDTGKPLKTREGEDYLLTGVLDQIARDDEGKLWTFELKNTTSTPGSYYFRRYDPSTQLNTYALVSSIILPNDPLDGVIIEAAQNAVGFTRFERYLVHRTPSQNDQWLRCICRWVKFAEDRAYNDDWADFMNPANIYGDSVFRMIMAQPQEVWEHLLNSYCERKDMSKSESKEV